MFVCQAEIQTCIHICSICRRIYARRIRRNGGKQRWNKRMRDDLQMSIEIFWNLISRSWSEFPGHLATIRLDEERNKQYPPVLIILQTARILFKTVISFARVSLAILTRFFRLKLHMNNVTVVPHLPMNNMLFNIWKQQKR